MAERQKVAKQSRIDQIISSTMTTVYLYMFIGLMLTAGVAYITYKSDLITQLVFTNPKIFFGLIIGELVLVFAFSFLADRISAALSFVIFTFYSLLNGLTLAVVFIAYTKASVYSAFLVTCITFGVMSAIGFFTKKDLSSIGMYLLMGLIGVIIAGFINIFIMNDTFGFFISLAGVAIFIGLTAYDTQKIKNVILDERDIESVNKIAIWGALALYLDFINIFLYLLRFMGKRRS